MSADLISKFQKYSSEIAKHFVDYDPIKYNNVVASLAANVSSTNDIEKAGFMVIYEAVKSAGSIKMYLKNAYHRLDPEVYNFITQNSVKLQEFMDKFEHLNYFDHDYFSASTVVKVYLLRPQWGDDPIESPLQMYLRVSAYLYHHEGIEKVLVKVLEMARHKYTPASPGLLNEGTEKSQGSSCFLLELGDNLPSILGTGVRDAGLISQHKGGLGIGLGRIRHSAITGAGMSSGVVPIMRILDKLVQYVDQGGSRSGAGTGHLPIWHIDIWDFINSTNNFSQNHALRISHLNTSVWTYDLFMQRAVSGGLWTVFCPAKAPLFGKYGEEFEKTYLEYEKLAIETEIQYNKAVENYKTVRKLRISEKCTEDELYDALKSKLDHGKKRIDHKVYKARDLLKHISDLEMKSGFPYMMYGDSVNMKTNQKNIGTIDSSNLCQEICEVSTPDTIATCNLSSISLKAFVDCSKLVEFKTLLESIEVEYPDMSHEYVNQVIVAVVTSGIFNFRDLGHMARSVNENLNRVIDTNYYPCPEKTENTNIDTRPLGIGVSGLSDVFCKMKIPYESKCAEALNKGIFACIYFNCLTQSAALAARDGAYKHFDTGECTIETTNTISLTVNVPEENIITIHENADTGIHEVTMKGSPAANGFFQFDLWRFRAQVLKEKEYLDERIYHSTEDDDEPIDPIIWGQEILWVTNNDYSDLYESDKRGDPSEFDKCKYFCAPSWEDLSKVMMRTGLRNSLQTTVMPTASTAQKLRNTEATEAPSSNFYSRKVTTGTYIVSNPHLVKDLEELEIWSPLVIEYLVAFGGSLSNFKQFIKDFRTDFFENHEGHRYKQVMNKIDPLVEIYKTMFEISQKTVLKYARQRGIYIDQSQSTNVFMKDPTIAQVQGIHMYGWKLGLKTGLYYLRLKNAAEGGAFTLSAKMLEYSKRFEPTLIGPPDVDEAGPVCTLQQREEGCLSCQ